MERAEAVRKTISTLPPLTPEEEALAKDKKLAAEAAKWRGLYRIAEQELKESREQAAELRRAVELAHQMLVQGRSINE
jgi:hypothetical protein